MTSKTTKRALLSSIISIVLCFAMLLGTTFAWFTDNAATGSNVITSGNLDVVVEYTLGDKDATGELEWADLDKAKDLFQKGLWEPGHTEVVALRVTNNGSLALKYTANMNINNETIGKTKDNKDIVLSEVLTVESVKSDYLSDVTAAFAGENGITYTTNTSFKAADVLGTKDSDILKNGDIEYVIIKVDMAETVGNEANHDGTNIPTIDFGINVVATQYTHENDTFGNQYDANAAYPTVVKTVDELTKALTAGENVKLDDDIALTSTLMTKKNAVIDLNGNTITAPASGNMFQSSSDSDPSLFITSSADGAEINVSGGDTAVLLGYGSTVIKNVTINVTGCDNFSPAPFNVYGDLTLGEGTVVNVDYLGSSLISNNGKVAIVIDGADINIGTYKTNGGAIIYRNQATTVEMKNTSMKIANFVLSPFGGDKLVDKLAGVTIENCTFDVTDSNGAACTFVPDTANDRYSLKQK